MTDKELSLEIAKGLVATGVEGGYDAVSCSTAGDYPSMGCSQWEGARGNTLLGYIDGGIKFMHRTYSDIVHSGEIQELKNLLCSKQGQIAQQMILADDCMLYVQELKKVSGFWDSRCIIYAGIWCPTSHIVVRKFLQNRVNRGITDLATLKDLFAREYARAADCEEYSIGYKNRAVNTFNYVATCDLSVYGVPVYAVER